MGIAQEKRALAVDTPLGEDVLVLTAFTGEEEMSRLFHYRLEMFSEEDSIAAKKIVGKDVTFRAALADGTPRYFNGVVSRFSAGDRETGLRRYYAEVVPWLWFFTRTADCRIFQNKSVPEIVEKVFKDLGFSDFSLSKIKGTHKKRDYCVQYRETDFNFVSRLMEEEGIFYYFQHADGKHTMVLADQVGGYHDLPENEVEYEYSLSTSSGSDRQAKSNRLTRWEHQYEFIPGKWAQTDYNFKDQPARGESTPAKLLMTDEKSTIALDNLDKFEIYDYPGEYADKDGGRALTKLRMEEEEAAHDVVRGEGWCKTFTPGGKFKIKRHDCKAEEGKGFVVTSVRHTAKQMSEFTKEGEEEYGNSFTCIPDSVPFRPRRTTPKPTVHGVQPAVVTGPAGEEIWPDSHGRVKVQFFWDREGKRDENSSCWVRVSQDYAGKGWGAVTIPRIGQEVIVDFVEGDPDQPIITGRVYNADQTPPYPLPGKKMVSGLKSESTPGGGGYNEYIMDDTKGNELIREHGQFDKESTIENDERHHIKRDRKKNIDRDETTKIGRNRTEKVGVNEKITIGANRTEKVGANEKIGIRANRSERVGGNETIAIVGNRTETVKQNENITIKGGRTESVSKEEKIAIGGGRTESVAKDEKISIGGGRTESVAKDEKITVTGGRTESIGKVLQITAGDAIMLKTGDASITLKKNGDILIKGKNLVLRGSGEITAKADGDMVLKASKIAEN